MGFVSRKTFTSVFTPDADAVNAPDSVLLRGDNLILDEKGVVALRPGSSKINGSPFADTDIHSLFTTTLSGTRYRMAGAGSAVYANGTSIVSGLAGSNDIAFGVDHGQILFARSTSKKKYDGTTVRNWGISMTGAKPTATPIPADGKTFASCASTESPAFVVIENDGTAINYAANHYAVTDPLYNAQGSLILNGNISSKRGVYQKTFATPQDFTTYDAGERGTDDDIISWYLYVPEPTRLEAMAVQVDVGDGQFQQDWYMSPVIDGRLPASSTNGTVDAGTTLPLPTVQGTRTRTPGSVTVGQAVPRVGLPNGPVGSANQWTKVAFRRGDFVRVGAVTSGKDWSTVKAVRVFVKGNALPTPPAAPVLCRVDTIRITGGANRPLLGQAEFRYQYVRNASGYQAKSALSPLSDRILFSNEAASVTIPADASRDSQVNEIWLFRRDPKASDTWYRVLVKTGVSGTGPYVVSDYLSGDDALTLDIRAELDNTIPPNNIIGIVGPHFDRTLVLTSDGQVWPSRKLDPDAFSTSQTITIAGVDETPYWIVRALDNVFVGTSKDIYRLSGTGAELPDGTIDYILRPLNMDHRPINTGVAHEGDQMAFFSDDGWRATQGSGTTLLTGLTSLLYRGKTRHGVSPVNVTGGRIRAVLSHGQLVAITPEGASTTSSTVLYRYVFAGGIWYRHTFAQSGNWRSIHREPDGTLIAGDDAGTVWTLDTGTQDNSVDIPVILWTKVDDCDLPYQRKKFGALEWRGDTGGAAATIALHLDGSTASPTQLTLNTSSMQQVAFDLANNVNLHQILICKQLQFKVTGSFSSFHLYDYGLQFRERPIPIIGRVPDTHAGSPGIKIISGYVLKCNTLGSARIITPYLDGVADTETFSLTTDMTEPETHTLRFSLTGRRATDIGFAVDGEIEIDSWSPIVTQRQPVGVLVWDSGPIDLGAKELVWLRELYLKVRAGADLVVTPYFDGTAFPTVTVAVTANVDSVYRVPVGRAYVGRQPRLVVTSCEPFYPYWVRCQRRTTGVASQKPAVTVNFTLETGA